ncbi:hypothetical protein GQR58_005644 [Nymphon striatum]|nr:hypothetical protein GQR58_005644 [Nymphon striatum]
MGAIGYSMDGSGLDVLWQTVYAGATVQHMLNGHAYARALRAPLSDISRANNPSPIKPHCLDHVDTNQLRQKLSSLIDKDCDIHDIQVDLLIKNFVDVIERASVDVAAFRTGKLWINYIRQITILKLFIHAERAKGTMDNEAIVVFDGYECTTSTKSAEQKRRATKSSSRDIMFDESMQTVTTQSAFSSNDRNKTRLISMLGHGTTRVPSGKVGLNDYSYLKTQCKYCNNSIQVMKLELSIIIVKSKGPVTLIQDQWELGRTSRKGNILKFVPHSGWKLRLA